MSKHLLFGLINNKNNCYLNCVLQCLCHTNNLYNILNDDSLSNISKPLLNQLKVIFSKQANGKKNITPDEFKNVLANYKSKYLNDTQEDAYECFLDIINYLNRECDKKINCFNGNISSVIECECNKKHQFFFTEKFMNLSLYVKKLENVENIIKEKKYDLDEFYCEKCNNIVKCSKTDRIKSLKTFVYPKRG